MPTLEWIGKSKVVNHHLDVPYHVLERKYSYDEKGQHAEDNGSENMIIHGDNLIALKSLLPQYEGKIKCIYIDPPYNTGNENWVYNDNVNDPRIKKWLGEVVGKEGEDLSRHDKWLCMMYPRLRLLQKLLADDGAIFISIDDNELYHLKLICDEIFGKGNYLTTITRQTGTHTGVKNRAIVGEADYILVYAKNIVNMGLNGDYKKNTIKKLFDADSNDLRRNYVVTYVNAIELARNGKFKDALKKIEPLYRGQEQPKKIALSILSIMLNKYTQYVEAALLQFYCLIKQVEKNVKIPDLRAGKIRTFYECTSYLDLALCVNITEDTSNHITIHKAKGAEYDNEFIVGNKEFLEFLLNPNIEGNEEHRVYYVALSRAKKRLFLHLEDLSVSDEEIIREKYGINVERI